MLHDAIHRIRPYEVHDGDTDRAFDDAVPLLHARLRDRRPFDVLEHAPAWLGRRLAAHPTMKDTTNTLVKIRQHLRDASTATRWPRRARGSTRWRWTGCASSPS